MVREDFNKIKEIAKELNKIRLRNNLRQLQLIADEQSTTYYDYHKEWNEVTLITRGEHPIFDCKIAHMEQNKDTKEIKEMDYEKYINYK